MNMFTKVNVYWSNNYKPYIDKNYFSLLEFLSFFNVIVRARQDNLLIHIVGNKHDVMSL